MPLIPIDPFRDMERRNMDDRCQIVRDEWVDDGEGSGDWVPAVLADDVPCYLSGVTATETERYAREVQEAQAKVSLPFDTVIDEDCRILITTRGDQEWQVTGVPLGSDFMRAAVKAFVKREE